MNRMRRLKTALLALATGEILTAATSGLAQSPTVGPSAAAPVTLSSTGPATTESSNAAGSKTGAQTAGADAEKQKPTTTGANSGSAEAGYSWRDKQLKSKHPRLHSTKVNPNLIQAKGPEFAIGSDGTSRITVQLSRKVEVVAEGNRRRFTYDLPNVQVAVANDMNPLITTHFSTPLQNARLIPQKKGARLVVDLRESVTPLYSIKDSAGGGAILEVVLPKSLTKAPVAADGPTKKSRAKPRTTGKSRRSRANTAAPQSGIGPRL
jgi:hypothetical protein